jgi:tripartite-type tricarboxylate transporter receptor subunit TctC
MMKPHQAWITVSLITTCGFTAIAHSQQWPAKPIRFVIAQPPGGQNDVQARIIGLKLTEMWGQPVVFDNRPGAGGAIGFEVAAQAPNDGYTLAMGSISTLAVIPSMPRKPRYDPLVDFAPVTLVSTSPYVVTLHPSVPARTLKELVALAKAKPGALSYASSGTATGIHLTTELFKMVAGIDMLHVPYKGGAPATTDLMGGQVGVMFNNVITAVPHVKSGKLRALAVTTAKRSAALPEISTIAEAGYAGAESSSWQGIVTRAGAGAAVVNRMHADLVKVLAIPDVRNAIVNQGNDIAASTPQEFAVYIRAEMDKWTKVIKTAGVRNE